jgi:uncharacterized protein YdaU (DUF1376 family)
MKCPDAWMPLYGADFQIATAHMTAAQRGAYLDLLLAAWARDGRLPDDDVVLCRLARCDAAEWAQVSATVREKFVAKAGYLTQRRLTLELQKAKKHTEKRRKQTAKATAAAAEKRALKQRVASVTDDVTDNVTPDVTIETTTTTTTINQIQEQKPERTAVAVPDWIDPQIWEEWKAARKLTVRRQELTIKQLTRLRDAGEDPAEVIEASIRNGWKGLFAQGGKRAKPAAGGRREVAHDAIFTGRGNEPKEPIDITPIRAA